MKTIQQEFMIMYRCWRIAALSNLIEEFAYKNRAKIVQRLLELKHKEEEKLGLNKSLGVQYGLQNPSPKGLVLGEISHNTNHDKEVQ
jgi:hypothetical protein